MEGGEIFPSYYTGNCTFLTKFFFKKWKFANKKGTFEVNLVFTAILACTKRALFITKKGTFSPLKKIGHVPPVLPQVPTPLIRVLIYACSQASVGKHPPGPHSA
jgi:hypothetical protein